MMGAASAYAPGHLTGLFQICNQAEDPLYMGARGSGVSLDIGVYTKVIAEESSHNSQEIILNGRSVNDAYVSETVIKHFLKQLRTPFKLRVEHLVETPMIAGFGSSGGGALSLALALNEATKLSLSRLKAAQIAHIAEIECKTGLGSVFAAERGGFGILTEPGAPGIGKSITYPRSDDFCVVYLFYGPIPTKEALSNPVLRKRINDIGGVFVDKLTRDPTPEHFMKLSRRFTEHVGLVTPRLNELFRKMDAAGYTFTMAMFGEVAFSVISREKAHDAAQVLEKAIPNHEAVIVGIDDAGANLVV